MRVFKRLGMVGYAALVGEMISWARTRGILVGPGRGSSAGSCLLYCLGITDIDPLESGTLFERFLDPERAGMPDVDSADDATRSTSTWSRSTASIAWRAWVPPVVRERRRR